MIDLFPNEGSQSEELAIDPMQYGLEQISLTCVLRVEQFQNSDDEELVYVLLGNRGLQLRRLKESQEKCVHQLRQSREKRNRKGEITRKHEKKTIDEFSIITYKSH